MNEFKGDESTVTTAHLDDETFVEMTLGGTPDSRAQSHLASCAECRAELKRFADGVSGFSMASLAWSEEKSAGLPALRPIVSEEKIKDRASRMTVFGWALTAMLAFGIGIPVTLHENTLRHEAVQRASVEDDSDGLNSPEQIAKDNQLMADVNYELMHSQELSRQAMMQRSGGARVNGNGLTPEGKNR